MDTNCSGAVHTEMQLSIRLLKHSETTSGIFQISMSLAKIGFYLICDCLDSSTNINPHNCCFGHSLQQLLSEACSLNYLQSNDTLTSLDLLSVEMPCLFIGVFHPNIDFCVHAFGLCLYKEGEKRITHWFVRH